MFVPQSMRIGTLVRLHYWAQARPFMVARVDFIDDERRYFVAGNNRYDSIGQKIDNGRVDRRWIAEL